MGGCVFVIGGGVVGEGEETRNSERGTRNAEFWTDKTLRKRKKEDSLGFLKLGVLGGLAVNTIFLPTPIADSAIPRHKKAAMENGGAESRS